MTVRHLAWPPFALGARPALRAATGPAAQGGGYFGPRRPGLRRRFCTGPPAAPGLMTRPGPGPALAGVRAANRGQLRLG
jgi:hypothetical protein